MSGPLQALLCILYSILAPSQRLSNCCLIRLSEQMPVHSMQLEVCSLMASTPDGACKLQLEEMQSKTAPCREAHNSFYLFLLLKKKSQVMCFSQGSIIDMRLVTCSLEDLLYTKNSNNDRTYLAKVCWGAVNYAALKF